MTRAAHDQQSQSRNRALGWWRSYGGRSAGGGAGLGRSGGI
ncbi:hypothetical protein [Tomitella gaofuii]|nr:hypothetical protein [Tomitella gaofuii]